MAEEYDYIVVGGGAAGCVAAARLVTRGGRAVLLLEAGHSHRHPLLDMPPGIFKMINGSKYMRYHQTVPQEHLNGRVHDIPQGNVLGGGIVGQRAGLHARPAVRLRRVARAPARRQRLPRLGLGRRPAALPRHGGQQPAARRAPRRRRSAAGLRSRATSTTCRAGSSRACRRSACRSTTTSTGRRQRGVGFYQFMNRRGRRSSAAYAFIAPLEDDPRLTVRLNAPVRRIEIENGRAVGRHLSGRGGRDAHRLRRRRRSSWRRARWSRPSS